MEFLWGDNVKENKGMVLKIDRASIHDGPGIRTVIFLKGCPLRCKWCSTPESQSFHIEKGYGMEMSVEEVIEEIMKDEIFFFHSDGGITISGGEVLGQAEFAKDILKETKKLGISTGIETSLYSDYRKIEEILPYLDFLYIDIKHMDGKKHKNLTGVDNARILENIKKVDNSKEDFKIYIRTPIIPGINDDDENLRGVGKFCKDIKKLERIELLPYHRLGARTYEILERKYELEDLSTPSKEYILDKVEFLSRLIPGVEVEAGGGF